jgi:hypothetical protein
MPVFAEISPRQVEEVCIRWRLALDAAESALAAAARAFPPEELARHRSELAAERRSTLELLKEFARAEGVSVRLISLWI